MKWLKTGLLTVLTIKLSIAFSFPFHCYYGYDDHKRYLCINCDLDVKVDAKVQAVTGLHAENETNSKVEGLVFLSREMRRIPGHLLKMFSNLKEIVFSCHSIYESKCLDENALHEGVFAGGGKVKTIALQGHHIIGLKARIFEGMGKLEYIFLDSCNISDVDKNAFKGLQTLKLLSLKYNEIENFAVGTFDPITKLENLELQGNELSSLTSGIFGKLKKLKSINLRQNKLKLVDFKLTVLLPMLESVNLIDNYCINDYYSEKTSNLILLDKDLANCSIDEHSGLAPWNQDTVEKLRVEEQHLNNEVAMLNSVIEKSCELKELQQYYKELQTQIRKLSEFKRTHLEVIYDDGEPNKWKRRYEVTTVPPKQKLSQLAKQNRNLKKYNAALNEVSEYLANFMVERRFQ